RAVHVTMTYEQAERLIRAGSCSGWQIMKEMANRLEIKMAVAKKNGLPKPPLPKDTVAHNSTAEVVDHREQVDG
ncbi:MAG: hypothetical protein V3T23_04490, partial [Nitrososphaerales archaeon]